MSLDVEALYKQYGPMVLRRCRQLLHNETFAVDAMQDVFVNVLRKQNQLSDGGLSSLLYRMATNVCLNILRRHRRHPGDSANENEDLVMRLANADNLEDHAIAANLLNRIFKRHPESTRTIATLHLLDGMTLEEVAKEVGMSVSGVRKRLRGLRSQIVELQEV